MIPRLKANLGIKELIATCKFWQQDAVEQFEVKFAKLMGQKYAVAFPYGRTGILAALKAMGIENQEVICPAYTCVVVPHAIVTSGNIPVFVDCDADSYNMDMALVEHAITKKTGAIIATSIFGHPVNLDALEQIRQKHPHIKIIQDCAHSFSAEWQGRPVQKEGNCAIFGLNISKLITSIFGGIVTTDDDVFLQSLKTEREKLLSPSSRLKSFKRWLYLCACVIAFNRYVYGFINRLEKSGLLNRFVKYFDETKIDMPADYLEAMAPIEARVGMAQCDKYEQIIVHRRELARYYYAQLKRIPNFQLPQVDKGATFSHFVIYTEDAQPLINYMLKKGIQLGELIDYHIPNLAVYKNHTYFSKKISESLVKNVINLPIHLNVTPDDANYIVTNIMNFFEDRLYYISDNS